MLYTNSPFMYGVQTPGPLSLPPVPTSLE